LSALRRLATLAGLAGWLYSWFVIRGVRSEYAVGDLGTMPVWLLVVMALSSTILIAAALSAAMRAGLWPSLSVAAGLALFCLIVFGQLAVMRSASRIARPSVADALTAAARVRGPVHAGLFMVAIPAVLVVAGITADFRSRFGVDRKTKATT
jgi:hypothetical protein